MEESEVPLEHLHEQVHHTAEHSRERWFSWVALSMLFSHRPPRLPGCSRADT
jgi:hypothetical protein